MTKMLTKPFKKRKDKDNDKDNNDMNEMYPLWRLLSKHIFWNWYYNYFDSNSQLIFF